MEKVTAGRDQLGAFAPKFAQLNDDVLFGEVWAREKQLCARDRSIVTVVSLMASGRAGFFFAVSYPEREKPWRNGGRDGGNFDSCRFLCRLAESMGCIPDGKGSIRTKVEYTFLTK